MVARADAEFLDAFESGTLSPSAFHHHEHVRLTLTSDVARRVFVLPDRARDSASAGSAAGAEVGP